MEAFQTFRCLSLYLAQATENLKFGAFFNTIPAWHPLRLAEDFATVDIMTGGRVRFGIGRGYINREVETLGSPLDDDEENREKFEEQVEIIFKAWNEQSFSHRGKYYDLPAKVIYREEGIGGDHARPASRKSARGVLATHLQRQSAGIRVHDKTRNQGRRTLGRARP